MNNKGLTLRIIHRYLGFFLAGIMIVYAISGIVLIFRDTEAFKKDFVFEKTVEPNLSEEAIGQALKIRRFSVTKTENDVVHFKEGTYNKATGEAHYTLRELPIVLEKITSFHKAKSGDPLFFFNIFFGLSLFFFAISSFWMFLPNTPTFKKGLIFTAVGVALTLLLLIF